MSKPDADHDLGSGETAHWHAEHREIVERVYRSRLRSVPEHIVDGTQSFWLDFHEQKLYARYNPAICPSKAGYVGALAHWRAVRFLHRIWSERTKAAGEEELPRQSSGHTGPRRGEQPATQYLLQLIATNRLQAPEALIFLGKEWAQMGPVELAEKHLSCTLLQLCDFIESRLGPPEGEGDISREVLAAIREQLALPVEHPIGRRDLTGVIEEFENSRGSAKDVLLYWLDQARRVCRLDTIGSREAAIRLRQAVLTDVEARLRFAVRSVPSSGEPEKLLVWLLERLLNLREHSYGHLSCCEATEGAIRRIRFIHPRAPVPDHLPMLLAGKHAKETVLQRLAALNTDSSHAARAIEERYRRFQRKGGKEDG